MPGLKILDLLEKEEVVVEDKTKTPLINPLTRPNRPKPARLSILLCVRPEDFTRQWGTPGSPWVKVLPC